MAYNYMMGDSSLLALGVAMMVVFFIIAVAFWIYSSFAFMAIARKAKDKMPGLAWIPGIGPTIVAFRAAGMHWWPWLLLIGIVIPFVGWIALLVFAVFSVVWTWKLFEKIRKPGWWSILMIIPVVNLVMMGIAAWSKK